MNVMTLGTGRISTTHIIITLETFRHGKQTQAPLVIFAHNVDSPIHQGASSRSHSASSPATWFQYFHQPSSGDLPVHSSVYRKGHSKRSSWPCQLTECPGPKVRCSKSLRMVTGLDNAFVSKFASGLIYQVLVAWGRIGSWTRNSAIGWNTDSD